MSALSAITDATPPYLAGVDDIGDAPLGSENPLDPTPDNPLDPIRSEGDFRRAVITLLTEIRDALVIDDQS